MLFEQTYQAQCLGELMSVLGIYFLSACKPIISIPSSLEIVRRVRLVLPMGLHNSRMIL